MENSEICVDTSTGRVRPYIPKVLQHTAFNIVHRLSHLNGRATCRQVKERYVWSGINKDVLKWTRKYISCQKAKIHRHNKLQPKKINVPDSRFNHIHLGIIHMPVVKGYKYCLTIIDSPDIQWQFHFKT